MSPRYLLLVGDDLEDRTDKLRLVAERVGLTLAFANGRLAAFVNETCPCIPLNQAGCILGFLFPRHGRALQLGILPAGETAVIAASEGQALLGRHWGGYVAALDGGDSVRVLRDPSGNFPCYHSTCCGAALFASDAELLVAATGSKSAIDYAEIGRQLHRAFVPTPATALVNVRELLAGFAVRLPDGLEDQRKWWSPWDHVADRKEETEIAAERLARTVRHCVMAWASSSKRSLLSVSGGLDSSIVAACLARTGIDATCLTMFTDDPGGDERPFARALCDHLGLPLIERPYRLADVDISLPLGAHLPRPRDRTQAVAYERVHHAVAAEIEATSFMTGNGGDHVFGYSQSAAALADRYLSEGIGRGTLATLLDVCRQTGCSLADAVGQAWRLLRAPPDYRVRPNPLFLARDFLATPKGAEFRHPWLDAPRGALPGKAAHVATILRVQLNLEPSSLQYPVLNPLVSQPIIENCLGIPSWAWRTGGRDRSLARNAFARDLPALILARRIKGTPGRFAAQLLDHFRGSIRDRLLGGRLAANGIADADAIERALDGEQPVPDLERVRLLELLSAEAWIDHWAARPDPAEPGQANIRSCVHAPLPVSGAPIP